MNIDEATILKLTGLCLDEFRQLKFLKFNKDNSLAELKFA